jgi:hypothetical protein
LKPIVLPLGLFFLWKRQWRTLWVIGIIGTLGAILSFSMVGWGRFGDWITVSRAWSSGGILAYPVNQSIRGLAVRAFSANSYIEPLANIPWLPPALAAAGALLALLSWGVITARRSSKAITALEFALLITTIMLVSPLTEDLHFVWTLLPITALMLVALEELPGWRGMISLAGTLLIALYLGYPALSNHINQGYERLAFQGLLVERTHLWGTGMYLYGLVTLHLWLIGHLIYLRRAWHITEEIAVDK